MNTTLDIETLLLELRDEMRSLRERVEKLEQAAAPAAPLAAVEKPPAEAVPEVQEESIGEDELLAISAAVAAFLGVRAHIRQVRLISSKAWAQQGRASVQASHRLH